MDSPLQVTEILLLIAEQLGEETEQHSSYQNIGSLASLVATCKSISGNLQSFLYAQDLKEKRYKGLKHAAILAKDDIAVGILSNYPEHLLKQHINRLFRYRNRSGKDAWCTTLHWVAARGMRKTIKKLHELGAEWRYGEYFESLLPGSIHREICSYPALKTILRSIKVSPSFVSIIIKDKRTRELLEEYWPESSHLVAQFDYPPGLLHDRSRRAMYCMTSAHLVTLLAPHQNTVKLLEEEFEKRPELKQLPGLLNECSIHHLAIRAQNGAVLERFIRNEKGDAPYFVDNRGYNPLHFAVELAVQGNARTGPRGRAGSTEVLNILLNPDNCRINPMMSQTRAPYKTPLLIVAKHIAVDWNGQHATIKKIMEQLTQSEKKYAQAHGFGPVVYTMNRPDSNGNTVLRYITKAIIDYHDKRGSLPLEKLFTKMIKEYNADINLDVNQTLCPTNRPYIHSIKWMADRKGYPRFQKLVEELGGRWHLEETLHLIIPTFPTVDFPDDQYHATHLPLDHPYALPEPLNKAFLK
ncbi:hypothetical protein ACLX1H_006586 [Fusarium chlamydosporum]